MTDVDDDIEFPKELCVAVCGAAHDREFMIAVNDVKLEDTIDRAGNATKSGPLERITID